MWNRMKANMTDKAILITDIEQVHLKKGLFLSADFRANEHKFLFLYFCCHATFSCVPQRQLFLSL